VKSDKKAENIEFKRSDRERKERSRIVKDTKKSLVNKIKKKQKRGGGRGGGGVWKQRNMRQGLMKLRLETTPDGLFIGLYLTL
jgi:hypothetical protein